MSRYDLPLDMRRLKMGIRVLLLYKLILRGGETDRRIIVKEFHSSIGVHPSTIQKYLAILQARRLVTLRGRMVVARKYRMVEIDA